MPVQNPLSIPGGWKKDTPKDTPAAEEPNPVESQTIPRTPAGVVSETGGGILDDAGREIGKVAESEDGKSLAGNPVTATGDIVDKTSGDVLGRASLESYDSAKEDEYTTGQQEEKPQQQEGEQEQEQPQQQEGEQLDDNVKSQRSGSGFFGTLRSGVGSLASFRGGSQKSDAGGSEVPASEAPEAKPLDEGNVQDTARDAASEEAPSVAQDTPHADDQSQAPGDDLPAKDGAISLDDREQGGDDNKTDAPESTVGDNKSQADLGLEQTGDEAQEALSKKGDEAQEGLEDTKSQANVDEPEQETKDLGNEAPDVPEDAQSKVDDTAEDVKSKAGDVPDDAQSKVEDTAEDAKSKAGDVPDDTQSKTGDIPDDAQSKVDDTAEDAKSKAGDIPDDTQSKVDDTAEDAKSKAGDVPDDAQSKLDDTAEEGADAPKDLGSEAPEAPEDAQSKLGDTADDAQSKLGDTADDAQSKVEDTAEDAKSKVEDTADDVQSKAEDTVPADAEAATQDEQPEDQQPEEEGQKLDYSILKGAKVNKVGNIVNDNGDVIGRLVDGDPKKLQGKRADEEGKIWNDSGKVIGQAEPLPEDEREDKKKTFAPFENFPDAIVEADGRVVSEGRQVGTVVEGDPKRLKGSKVDEDGDILDRNGNTVGRAEAWDEPEPIPEEPEGPKIDYSVLKGAKVNKVGNLVNDNGDVVGRIVDGDAKKLQGKRSDEEGKIWNDSGKVVGQAEPLSDDERDNKKKSFAPFENFPDAVVEADGRVMAEGRQVGTVVEGDPKRLKGSKVDEDGDILDRNGNTVGRAEAWDEPEPIPEEPEQVVDRSILAGKRVNKAGNVVDSAGTIFGKVVEGNVSSIVGRMCDKEGNIRSESGDIIGRAELVPEGEREGSKEGPFAELSGLTVRKDGKVVTPSDEVVGRLTSGDPKKLSGRAVDEDGDVVDKNGNVLGKAERYEEPEEVVEEKKKGPLFGRKVNKEGNVVDEDGNVIAKLVSGDLLTCSGKEIDDDGDVINSKGNTVGHVALLEDIPEPEPEPEPEVETEEVETEEEKKVREQAEADRKLAGQLSGCIEGSLEKIKPICKLITDKIDKAERTPKEELDEEQLVREVKPLIEEGGKILSETNGIIRGLDPDGRIQRQAKQKSGTREASPEEYHLAEVLKELTGNVSQTVDNAKRKIDGMPHAKKELNPLWGLLMEPLGQILAAVGLLLTGVLGLVGRLLSGLGLGGIVDGLLGGLGLNKILGSLGLGAAYDALVGKKKK